MPRHDWFQMGSWNVQCDQCGRIFKSTEMMRRWDNAWVDSACFEIRHPQDYVRGIPDNQAAPYSRIRPPLSTTYLDLDGSGWAMGVEGIWQAFGNYFQITVKVALDDWTPPLLMTQSLYGNDDAVNGGFLFYVEDVTGRLGLRYATAAGVITTSTSSVSPTVGMIVVFMQQNPLPALHLSAPEPVCAKYRQSC